MSLTVSGKTKVTKPNIRFGWYGILTSCTGPNLLRENKEANSMKFLKIGLTEMHIYYEMDII